MLGNLIGSDVPATIAAGSSLVVAGIAIERTAMEKLLQPRLVLGSQLAGVARQGEFIATTIAVTAIELFQQGRIMIVYAPRDDPLAIAEGTSHSQLGGDRFTNEGALVGKFIEKLRQIFFHLERDHRGLRRLAGHERGPRSALGRHLRIV